MKMEKPVLSVRLTQLLCVLAGLYAIFVAIYIFTETGKPLGARDFHQFWYAGNFIRQGRDPYAAYFAGEQPKLPVKYLDGVTINQYPVAQPQLAIIPSNTPMMLALLTPFSLFSWNVAKWAFMIFNLILMLITGWLVLRRLPFAGVKLAPLDEVLIFLVYFDFSATRIAIENGQTTLLVFLLMILALLYADRSWQVTGLTLGIALSKYSLSLPIFLFFLYKKKFKILLTAIGVQVFGILALAAIGRDSPVTVAMENYRLFFQLFDQPGVHLARQFEIFTKNHLLTEIPVLLMTLLVFIPLFLWLRRRPVATESTEDILDFHLLSILFLWTILVAYHRLYDTLILLFFVVLVFKGLAYPNIWKLTKREQILLLMFMAALPLILILPARIVDKVLTGYYGTIADAVTSILFLLMLFVSLFLLRCFLHNSETETILQRAESHELPNDSHRDARPGWVNNP
jgi:hypothetical protein